LAAVRESIPTEAIIRAYLDESVEQEEEVVIEPVKEEEPVIKGPEDGSGEEPAIEFPAEEPPPAVVPAIDNIDTKPVITRLAFNNFDEAINEDNQTETILAPKDIDRLEEISAARNLQRKLEEEGDDDDDAPLDRIKIAEEPLDLGDLGITEIGGSRGESPLTLDFDEIM
jgi:hypothetical protein